MKLLLIFLQDYEPRLLLLQILFLLLLHGLIRDALERRKRA